MKRYVSIKKILWILLLLPIYKVGYISEIPLLNSIYDLGRYVGIAVTVKIFLKYYKYYLKKQDILLLLFSKMYIVFITVIMSVTNNDCIYSFVLVVMQAVLITYMLKKDTQIGLAVVYFVFELLVYLNLLSIILHPEGLYMIGGERIYTFVGHANNTSYYTLPMMALALTSAYSGGDKLRLFSDIIACVLSILLVGSATGIVVHIVFVGILVWELKKTKLIKFNYFNIYLIILLLSCCIIFFNVQTYFSFIIEIFLHRELDFTGRTYYWAKNLMMIYQSPIIGHGAVPGDVRFGGLSAHSYLLETLYEGGVILLLLFSALFYKVSNRLDMWKKYKISRILFSAAVAITMTCITESNISNDVYFIIFILCMNIDKICVLNRNENVGRRRIRK